MSNKSQVETKNGAETKHVPRAALRFDAPLNFKTGASENGVTRAPIEMRARSGQPAKETASA